MPVNLQLIIAPWVRSVGSSLWLCTARRSCRICPSSCWRRTAGIPHPPRPSLRAGCAHGLCHLLGKEVVLPS